MQIVDFTCI